MTAELKSPLLIRPPHYPRGNGYDYMYGNGWGDGGFGSYSDGDGYGACYGHNGGGGGIRSGGHGRGESTEKIIHNYRSSI